jgi:hypothetical protein
MTVSPTAPGEAGTGGEGREDGLAHWLALRGEGGVAKSWESEILKTCPGHQWQLPPDPQLFRFSVFSYPCHPPMKTPRFPRGRRDGERPGGQFDAPVDQFLKGKK